MLIKIGCEVFLLENDMLLLGKRKNCYGEGCWGLPGGHLEHGETIRACASRELKEELGIEGCEFRLASVLDTIDERGHYLHVSFILERYEGHIQCMEPELCYEWRFFNLTELPENIFSPHQKIVECFFKNRT